MCTHDRLLNHLECYMDHLVDCFEEFVKKSMLVISVAVGTLVLMVMYIIKLMSDRAANRLITNTTDDTEPTNRSSQDMVLTFTESIAKVRTSYENSKNLLVNYLPSIDGICKRTISSQILPTYSSFDDNFMQEVELCVITKPCESCKQTQVSEDLKSARPEPNCWKPASCIKKKQQAPARLYCKCLATRNSCCSMCCREDRPNEWME